jgi:hypothetical protein
MPENAPAVVTESAAFSTALHVRAAREAVGLEYQYNRANFQIRAGCAASR